MRVAGANDGIGDPRVGDQHILHVARQVDDHHLPMPSDRKRILTGPMAEVVTGSFSDSAAKTGSSGPSVSAATPT